MTPREPVVSPATPMPKGYGFLNKGNPYLTANVRRKTHAANKKLYVVAGKRSNLGLRAPIWILEEVRDEERATRNKRRSEVQRRDGADEREFEAAIKQLFPDIPDDELAKVVRRALEKRSGRVGRTKQLTVKLKARLAVTAHVRHHHTNYDAIIRGGTSRNKARVDIHKDVSRVLAQWRRQRKVESRKKAKATNHRAQPKKPEKQNVEHGAVEQTTLPHSGRETARSTRASSRLLNSGRGEKLLVLDQFSDDDEEDHPTSSDGSDEEEEYCDPDGLHEDSGSDQKEDEFAAEWDSDWV